LSARLKVIAKRLVRAIRPPPPRRARGVIDRVVDGSVIGWAVGVEAPDHPLRVRLISSGLAPVEVLASDKREDVAAAGLGTARCGFRCPLPGAFEIREGTELQLLDAETDSPICSYVCSAADAEAHPRVQPPASSNTLESNGPVLAAGQLTIVWPGDGSIPAKTIHARVVPHDKVPRIRGTIEGSSARAIKGWAYDTARADRPVSLDLYIDGALFQSIKTSIARQDVQLRHGCYGRAGFIFELPQNLENDLPALVQIRSPDGDIEWAGSVRSIPPVPNAKRAPAPTQRPPIYRTLTVQRVDAGTSPSSVALIVLNRNGASLLDAFLQTFARHNSHPAIEILVVDHGSTDESESVVAAHSKRLPVRWLARGENFSFSASNNWAAEQTAAELLVFANNDLEFCQDVIGPVIQVLADASIGMVGVQLLDKPTRNRAVGGALPQHLGVFFDGRTRSRAVLGFESRHVAQIDAILGSTAEVPAVTAAFAAMRRDDFLAIGGFEQAFFYGNEDVDLCLRVHSVLRKSVVIASHLRIVHHRGYTRTDPELAVGAAYQANWDVIDRRFGYWLRHRMARDLIARPGFWTSVYPRIAFAVTDARDNAAAGDYFTALELAKELQERWSCKAVFLDKQRDWFDLKGVDVLVVMRDDYDLNCIREASPHLVKIGWARNWIDRWAQRSWAENYDQYWASSTSAANHLRARLARPVPVVAIATDAESFGSGAIDPALASDYCFTGSYWGVDREIAAMLDPDALSEYRFALFGYGWEQHPVFARHARGGLPYSRMRDVYASTRIVIDDANSATKRWGSVNSRVFDALAAGALVLTNGAAGANEAFDGLLPTYDDKDSLVTLLRRYLADEPARRALAERLRDIVVRRHTYAHRAAAVLTGLESLLRKQLRLSLKIGAPNEAVREEWGDWHFAVALRRAFTRRGHTCRIDCLDRWDAPEGLGDHAVIVLRGLSRYEPRPHQINLMWNISHPDKIEDAEYERYDHVFVASPSHAKALAARLKRPVSTLLQCTDPERFHPDVASVGTSHDVLFVGNSRKVKRRIVGDAIEARLPIAVYGTRWDGLIPAECIVAEHIPNAALAAHYRDAGVLLNDHWDTMREAGFLSNRLFDAAACGARIVSDPVEGMGEVFEDFVATYSTPEELRAAVSLLTAEGETRRQERRSFARRIAALHSFDARAAEILLVIEAHHARRMHVASAATAAADRDSAERVAGAVAA
jgi:spore maturation protein CgeB/GT2 family glycosyltransferase